MSKVQSSNFLTCFSEILSIFVTQTNQGGAMHYTLKDHQGSLAATAVFRALALAN